jgi:hypothetical protein
LDTMFADRVAGDELHRASERPCALGLVSE